MAAATHPAAAQPAQDQPAARTAPERLPELRAHTLQEPPVIDGILDDQLWTEAPLDTGEWRSYNPLHGDTIPQKTKVWAAQDSHYLYFAFQCLDPQPSAIKTSITRRDNIWADDWVGLSLDALGTGQLSYHLMVNPSGVQLDMLNSIAGGEDQSPDYVWDSAGRINDSGYAVEIRLPLQTIRFRSGQNVRMGVLFWRRVS
ncbi:MAG: carbohydrate binding family 9 domain-containing protein, partial [Burkholderiales bacterium]